MGRLRSGKFKSYKKRATVPGQIKRLDIGDMPPELAEALAPRVKRLNYLGEWFKCAAHAPDVLLAFMHFTDALKHAIPEKAAETVVLTVATKLGNAYELNQHEWLGVRSGYGREWIADVERLAPDSATLMSDAEKSAQRYALAILRTTGTDVHQEFQDLLLHFDPAQAISIVMLVGRYFTHSIGVHSLRLTPPVPSIFKDGFNE